MSKKVSQQKTGAKFTNKFWTNKHSALYVTVNILCGFCEYKFSYEKILHGIWGESNENGKYNNNLRYVHLWWSRVPEQYCATQICQWPTRSGSISTFVWQSYFSLWYYSSTQLSTCNLFQIGFSKQLCSMVGYKNWNEKYTILWWNPKIERKWDAGTITTIH